MGKLAIFLPPYVNSTYRFLHKNTQLLQFLVFSHDFLIVADEASLDILGFVWSFASKANRSFRLQRVVRPLGRWIFDSPWTCTPEKHLPRWHTSPCKSQQFCSQSRSGTSVCSGSQSQWPTGHFPSWTCCLGSKVSRTLFHDTSPLIVQG